MNAIIQSYTIDVSSNNNFIQIPAMQGDGNSTRKIKIQLVSNGVPYSIDSDVTNVSIMGTTPDNCSIMNDCQIDSREEGVIVVNITHAMTYASGRGDYSIVFIGEGTTSEGTKFDYQIKSFPFHIITTPAPYNISKVVSSDEFQTLTKGINQIKDVVSKSEQIQNLYDQTQELLEDMNDARDAELIRQKNELGENLDGEGGRVGNEIQRIKAEEERNNKFDSKLDEINSAIQDSIDITDDLKEKRDNGYFKGDKGDPGNNAVVSTVEMSHFAFQIINGDLFIFYKEGNTDAGRFSLEDGMLFYDASDDIPVPDDGDNKYE